MLSNLAFDRILLQKSIKEYCLHQANQLHFSEGSRPSRAFYCSQSPATEKNPLTHSRYNNICTRISLSLRNSWSSRSAVLDVSGSHVKHDFNIIITHASARVANCKPSKLIIMCARIFTLELDHFTSLYTMW